MAGIRSRAGALSIVLMGTALLTFSAHAEESSAEVEADGDRAPQAVEQPGDATAERDAEPVAETSAAETHGREGAQVRIGPPTPVGIRFGEPLEEQRFRVDYHFERIQRQGLMAADRDVSAAQVLSNSFQPYTRTPRSLAISAHTVQLSYSPHLRVTLVAEIPFLIKELETRGRVAPGVLSERQTQGLGDIGFALVVPFIRKGRQNSHVYIGFDVPTGSFRRGGDMMRLPYDSQIGNGSVDFEWGWTYRGETNWAAWGGQLIGRHPLHKNGLEYQEGSRFNASLWGALRVFAGISASLRMEWQKTNNIRGKDDSFDVPFGAPPRNGIADPSENHKARGGTRLTLSPGLTFELPEALHQRLSIEFGVPFHQDLDGPQLEQDWSVKAGWQWGF